MAERMLYATNPTNPTMLERLRDKASHQLYGTGRDFLSTVANELERLQEVEEDSVEVIKALTEEKDRFELEGQGFDEALRDVRAELVTAQEDITNALALIEATIVL